MRTFEFNTNQWVRQLYWRCNICVYDIHIYTVCMWVWALGAIWSPLSLKRYIDTFILMEWYPFSWIPTIVLCIHVHMFYFIFCIKVILNLRTTSVLFLSCGSLCDDLQMLKESPLTETWLQRNSLLQVLKKKSLESTWGRSKSQYEHLQRCSFSHFIYIRSVWAGSPAGFRAAQEKDHKALKRVVPSAERISGCRLPSLEELYCQFYLRKSQRIIQDPTYPHNSLFNLFKTAQW